MHVLRSATTLHIMSIVRPHPVNFGTPLKVVSTSNAEPAAAGAAFFRQPAALREAPHHWQILQLAPTSTPGLFKVHLEATAPFLPMAMHLRAIIQARSIYKLHRRHIIAWNPQVSRCSQ